MNVELHRDLRKGDTVRAFADLLQSLFAAELVCPSSELWLVSPWVSDIPLVDNSAGQFAALAPEWDRAPVRLLTVLRALAERGARITLAVRQATHNADLRRAVAELPDLSPGCIRWREAPMLHEKGLLGDRFYLSGSFNFTFNGITLDQSEEVAHLCVDLDKVAKNRLAMQQRWLGVDE